jgi:hypothetical protein
LPLYWTRYSGSGWRKLTPKKAAGALEERRGIVAEKRKNSPIAKADPSKSSRFQRQNSVKIRP